MDNTHVVTPVLRVIRRTVVSMTDDRGDVSGPGLSDAIRVNAAGSQADTCWPKGGESTILPLEPGLRVL
jgi:hypothetical protein